MQKIQIQVRGNRETATITINAEYEKEGEVWVKRAEAERIALGLCYHSMHVDTNSTGFNYTKFIRKGSGQEIDVCFQEKSGLLYHADCPAMLCDGIRSDFELKRDFGFEYNA